MIDPNFPSAKVVAHSIAPNGEELITMELEFHRFILSELNTHRSFSRNAQSSRAVPIEKMIEQVRNSPAIPVHWGKNQAGMVAEKELSLDTVVMDVNYMDGSYQSTLEQAWLNAARQAAGTAEMFNYAGVHKQIVNRLLEPFMKTKGVVTATRKAYEAFFKLRCHKDAQPEIKLLAERMRDSLGNSTPNELSYGDYHLPYLTVDINEMLTEDAIKISASCCGQVSYRKLDDSLAKALKIYDLLNLPIDGKYSEEPPHFSPTEHIAKIVDPDLYQAIDYERSEISGNFNSFTFYQYRKALEGGREWEFFNL